MILIRAKTTSLLFGCLAAKSKNSTLSSSSHLLTYRCRYISNVVDSSTATPFIVKYLVDSVGLSSSEAAKAAKFISHIKTPLQPDSVLDFFRKNGFSDTDIKRIICIFSRVLCSNPESTLKPKFEGLRELGFSEVQIKKLVTASPSQLTNMNYSNLRPRIEFLSGFLCSNDELIKAFSADTALVSVSLERRIKPNISFMKECQFSNERIGSLMRKGSLSRSLKSLKSIAKRIVDLGFRYGSGMFYAAFRAFCRLNSDKIDARMKFLCSLGFTKVQVSFIVLKQPTILALSEKNLRETICFLVNEAGCDLSYVSKCPTLVNYSLTKRLIPRNYILQLLKKKGLFKKKISFVTIVILNEKRFLEKFIFPFKEKIPELHDIYLSASAGPGQSRVHPEPFESSSYKESKQLTRI